MADLSLSNRHRLRSKDVARLNDRFEEAFDVRPLAEDGAVDRADADDMEVVIQDGLVVAVLADGDRPSYITVRGLIEETPEAGWVTVDMGAVPHVHNGADTMAPGVTEADPSIREGDLVWVRDERNEQPLAVGTALVDGPEMEASDSGRVVETLHHVGDDLFELEV
jgi:PUA domain protein